MNPHLFATSLGGMAVTYLSTMICLIGRSPEVVAGGEGGPHCLHVSQARRMCFKDSVCKVRVPCHGTVMGHIGGWEAISEHRI